VSNGKGDKRRPLLIPSKKFSENWDGVFGKNKKKPKPIKK
jgi:hypothetical protein